jgi:hypothetical protein
MRPSTSAQAECSTPYHGLGDRRHVDLIAQAATASPRRSDSSQPQSAHPVSVPVMNWRSGGLQGVPRLLPAAGRAGQPPAWCSAGGDPVRNAGAIQDFDSQCRERRTTSPSDTFNLTPHSEFRTPHSMKPPPCCAALFLAATHLVDLVARTLNPLAAVGEHYHLARLADGRHLLSLANLRVGQSVRLWHVRRSV